MKKITLLLTLLLSWIVQASILAQVQDFEGTSVGDIPSGWVKYQSQNDDPGFAVSDQTGIAHSGAHFLAHFATDIASESTSWIVSEAFYIGNLYEISFYWRGKWSFSYNFSGAYISTASNDPVANPSDFTLLEEFSPNNYPDTWLGWNQFSLDLSQYQGQIIYIAFKYVGDNAHDFYVDDVKVGPMPYCEAPSNLIVSRNIDDYTVLDVSWTPVVGVDTYEVVWDAPGFDPNASGVSSAQVTGSSYTITGLQESTHYEVYIRSLCSSYNMSSWEGPIEETTAGPPPANDSCDNATAIGSLPYSITEDATLATNNNGFINVCNSAGMNDGVWFLFIPANNGTVNITATPNGWDNELQVYSGNDCGNLSCVDYVDTGFTGDAESLSVNVIAGTKYWINIGYWSSLTDGEEGIFDLLVTSNDVSLSASEYQIKGLKYYPNPVNNHLNISTEEAINYISVYDISGKKIYEFEPDNNNLTIDFSHWKKGIYFVKLEVNNVLSAFKIVKQ